MKKIIFALLLTTKLFAEDKDKDKDKDYKDYDDYFDKDRNKYECIDHPNIPEGKTFNAAIALTALVGVVIFRRYKK